MNPYVEEQPLPVEPNKIYPKNCPRHICDCDKNFVNKVLEYHKKCLNGDDHYCLKDIYQHGKRGDLDLEI